MEGTGHNQGSEPFSGEQREASAAAQPENESRAKVDEATLGGGLTAATADEPLSPPGVALPEWSLPRANFAATGGAVAAVALGLWSGLTCWLTGWTVVNALLGLALGIWGIKSPRQRMALVGIGMNLIAMLLTLIWRR